MTAALLPPGAVAQDLAPPLDTDAVQAVLRPDEIVFAFTLAEPHSFRWVISREYLVFDRIAGRKAIEKEAARLSTTLSAMLFDKISTADDRPLIVVRDGILQQVPFERLTLQGRTVGERHSVSYAPSLDALVKSRRAEMAKVKKPAQIR